MKIQWEKNCSRVDAIIKFYVIGEGGFETPNHESWLPAIIDKAFDGVTASVDTRKDLAGVATALKLAICKLRVAMDKVELEKERQMPALLWMRLMRENGITIPDAIRQDFEQWIASQTASLKMILFLYVSPDTGQAIGPRCSIGGFQSSIGFAAAELMVKKRKKLKHWPYGYEWIAELKARKIVGAEADVGSSLQAIEHDPVERTSAKKTSARPKGRSKRKARSIEYVERKCGTHVVAALQRCLEKEAQSKRSLLQLGGSNKRPYNCELSLDNLISKLRAKYEESLASCAASTLKSALPAFVSCPRGRPKGILKPKTPKVLESPKSPRIRR